MTEPKPHGARAHRIAAARQAEIDFAPIARGSFQLTEWEGRLAREARRLAHAAGGDRNDPAFVRAAVDSLGRRGHVFPPEVAEWRRARGIAIGGVGPVLPPEERARIADEYDPDGSLRALIARTNAMARRAGVAGPAKDWIQL